MSQELLAEAMAALEEAAASEQPIRFGHEVAGVLYAALLDTKDPGPHSHTWLALGWHRPSSTTLVVQACSCGAVREVVALEEPTA